MKLNRQKAAVLLAAALAVSMAGCGGGTKDATANIQAALEKANAVKSMDANMLMEMDMSIMGVSMETETMMTMSCFDDPLKLKADMTMDMGEMGSVSMSMYADMDGDSYTMYLYDGSAWTVDTVDMGELLQYDAQESMNLYLEHAADFTLEGSEEVNGSTADKYSGVIPGDAMSEVMSQSAATTSMESMTDTLDIDLSELYKDLGDLPITVWVDRQSGYPVRYSMDMSELMSSMLKSAMSAASTDVEGLDFSGMFTVDKMTLEMDCFNFNAATDFTIPEEALQAAQAGSSTGEDDPLSADNSLGSSYRLTWMEMDGDRYDIDTLSALSDEEFLITLNLLDDGVFQLDMYTDGVSETVEGTWTLDGTDLTLISEGEELAGELIGTSLTLTQDGETMGFELAQD